ncbi:vacuolar protein sorting-associated protein 16 homolog isoform X1 [Hydra vulgaris]|uniref:vacuolar protein sorting-associated protein 16 homolog isoform X1 n=1 Tax=Hydra vulgaris TaxID=6087 RepID=UPI0032E9EEB7
MIISNVNMEIELLNYNDDTSGAMDDWNPLGDVYYRKVEIYKMDWKNQFDLSKYIIVGSTFGGPIAITKDDTFGKSRDSRSIVYIFSASGIEKATIKWDGGKIVKMAWSNQEDLLIVSDVGVMYIYDMFGMYKKESSFFLEPPGVTVLEVEVFTNTYGTGICLLTSEYQFLVANNIYDIKLNRLQSPQSFSLEIPPSSWAVLSLPEEQGTKVIMAKDNIIFELDTFQHKSKNPPYGHPVNAFIKISVSFDQRFVAMFADTGLLWIGSSNLSDVYCQYNSNYLVRPLQLVWCGSGAVVGHWDNYLLVVGPKQDIIKFYVDRNVHLIQELDGVRLVDSKTTEFLQKVPEVVEDIYKLGSVKPGAILVDASKEFEKKSIRVDEYMKTIKDHLLKAVQECISAAGYEFDPKKQRRLLKAASFGKGFLQDMNPRVFVEMCQTVRVLNNVQYFKIGIPITYDQLQKITIPVLIDRLIARRLYPLAIKICDYLRLQKRDGASRVLAHWACYKVRQADIADELLAKNIAEKLKNAPGISYADIATKAYERGRTELALKLLDYEVKADKQVPLLIEMKKYEQALQKAVYSYDTELVHDVTNKMKKNLQSGEFLMKIRTFPLALSLFIKHCKNDDRHLLKDIYYQEDMFHYSGNVFVQDSFLENMLDARIKLLWKAKESFDRGGCLFSSQAIEESVKLLEFQSKLQDQLKKKFVNLSVTDTLYQLLNQGLNKQAEQLRKDFSIPDSRYWWTKIEVLGSTRDWDELERFSKSKKSPIGYEPFAEVCIKYGNSAEVEKYILKVPLEKRVKIYSKSGNFEKACEIAFETKSLDNLNFLSVKCASNKRILERINSYRSQLIQKQ